jgi:lysophospholipase L1-like esterase
LARAAPLPSRAEGLSRVTTVGLSRRKKIAFAIVTFFLVFVVSIAALLAADVYLHHRVQYSAGVNVWGYRGAVVGKKKPGETRIVALGGSTAFGYGLPWNESWPYYLEQKINARRAGLTPVVVVNLGIPTDTARTFVTTLNDYAYLDYDIVCLYEGYNDLGMDAREFQNATNPGVAHYLEWRYQSPIFRWTGYFPIFPLVLNEKAMAMRHGGNLNAAYGTEKIVFRPNLATRTTAAALETASELGVRIEKTFARAKPAFSEASDDGCGRWATYCGAVGDAVQQTISHGKCVVVITQPYLADIHVEQQTAMAAMLARRFAGDPRVRYVNLGRTIDIHDTSLVYDGIHVVARGNQILADALAPTLLEIIKG